MTLSVVFGGGVGAGAVLGGGVISVAVSDSEAGLVLRLRLKIVAKMLKQPTIVCGLFVLLARKLALEGLELQNRGSVC